MRAHIIIIRKFSAVQGGDNTSLVGGTWSEIRNGGVWENTCLADRKMKEELW